MPLRFVGLAQKFITSKKGGKGNARSVRSIGHVAWSRSVAMTKSWLAIIFLLCCLLSLSPALLWADDAVVWTNASGVSVTGNSLTKTNSTSAWDSGRGKPECYSKRLWICRSDRDGNKVN